MLIEENEKGVEKILKRRDRGRVLAMFSVIDKLDSSDIIKITGLPKSRISDCTTDLEGLSYLVAAKTENIISKGNTQNYFFLFPPNTEISKQRMQRFILDDEFEKDKAKIEELLKKGELTGVKK